MVVGAFLIYKDETTMHGTRIPAEVTGYAKKNNMYSPVIKFPTLAGIRFAIWPVGSSVITTPIGTRLYVLEDRDHPETVRPLSKSFRALGWGALFLGIALVIAFIHFFRLNVFSIVVALFVAGHLVVQI